MASYFYCHCGQEAEAVTVLAGLLIQLIRHLPDTSSNEPVLSSITMIKRLWKAIAFKLPKQYIVVDGLDECEPGQRKVIVECLWELINHCCTDEPGRVRVLFVSRDYADIRRTLHSAPRPTFPPREISISPADNEADIRTYTKQWIDKIARKYAPLIEDTVEYLTNLAVARAQGMFNRIILPTQGI